MTRLADLEPRWVHPNMFTFKCPHCRKAILSCKDVALSMWEQREVFEKEYPDEPENVAGSRPDFAWEFSGRDFETLTVSPSIDAAPSGCWHGHIVRGEIVE